MLPGDDDDLPPAEFPMDASETAPSIEPKEFLVPDADRSSDPSLLGEGEAMEGGSEAAEAAAQEVDALLSAEVVPEGLEGMSLEAPPALPEQPTFQLQLRAMTGETRASFKKALDGMGIAVNEKAWGAAQPIVSQLTEYQAIMLLQQTRALGIAAEAEVVLPAPTPSEEELALGALSSVPDAPASMAEAAPSVTLPKGEKDVLLCTPDHLPGGSVRETFGIIVAHRSIARRLFREEDLREKLQKELRSVPGRPAASLPGSHLQALLRDLLLDLRKGALAKGANSVLGVKLEAFPESGLSDPQLEQLRLVAFGTAAVVEKS